MHWLAQCLLSGVVRWLLSSPGRYKRTRSSWNMLQMGNVSNEPTMWHAYQHVRKEWYFCRCNNSGCRKLRTSWYSQNFNSDLPKEFKHLSWSGLKIKVPELIQVDCLPHLGPPILTFISSQCLQDPHCILIAWSVLPFPLLLHLLPFFFFVLLIKDLGFLQWHSE